MQITLSRIYFQNFNVLSLAPAKLLTPRPGNDGISVEKNNWCLTDAEIDPTNYSSPHGYYFLPEIETRPRGKSG
jgi:hypothetical protein